MKTQAAPGPRGPAGASIIFENEYVRHVIGADGQNVQFLDKRTGQDYCRSGGAAVFCRVKKEGKEHACSAASSAGGLIHARFGKSGIEADLSVTPKERYFVWEVVSVNDPKIEEFVFFDLALALEGKLAEPFAACALALNLQTHVPEIPGLNSRLRALCYPRFGFAGARVAIVGCPTGRLREVLQEAVTASPDLPHSSRGGPWALDAPINRGSYLFNFGNLSEETVDEWIKLARKLGLNQIDFHGGRSFRFGDCRPNPQTYPRGLDSLKAVIDRLHAAGIAAGLHTYAFFIDKSCPWVTPVPDPRLGKNATFTLAEPLTAEATAVRVVEPTAAMSNITGFFVRNSVTLAVEDELIKYGDVLKTPPYAFTKCQRGAYGTRATPHARGTQVRHLKECFGLFTPDGDSTLLSEVAARTAATFNECGFDMIYLDALDGEDILGGAENGWHYGSKFVFEIWKRLERPALMEMSTFHHHLWCVRSRMGAWDHPRRSHKKFIDIHCSANDDLPRIFLPGELGWWSVLTWGGPQIEPTFADDIEYLCAKGLSTDTGLALMGVDPESFAKKPAVARLATIFQRYENLRHANYFSERVKARLRAPGEEFTLVEKGRGQWQFVPAQYAKHKVEGSDGGSSRWTVVNKFRPQPARLRIEVLMSAGPYDSPDAVTLADFADARDFQDRAGASGVNAELQPSGVELKVGSLSACYTAWNANDKRQGAWTKVAKIFSPPLNLSRNQALGVWVFGEGRGEVLNLQLKSPQHLSEGIGDHYILIDFTGWRYFELIEPEGERYADYVWPYGSPYAIYRESVVFDQVETLSLWLNNLPPNAKATCYLSPVRALPLVKAKLHRPGVTVGGRTITFPTEIESGAYLEFNSVADCKLYGPEGELLAEVSPEGTTPVLAAGENQVTFTCEATGPVNARAQVTLITGGEPI